MSKISKERIIFDNYCPEDIYSDYDIAESYDLNEYEAVDDELICELRQNMMSDYWYTASNELQKFFNEHSGLWLAIGRVGRWNGVYDAGTIFEDFFKDFFYQATKDCPYWKIFDINGHLFLKCSHHDGSCLFEIKKINERGTKYYKNWRSSYSSKKSEKQIHGVIAKRYSLIPRFAEKVYGCPEREYQLATKSALLDHLNDEAVSFYS